MGVIIAGFCVFLQLYSPQPLLAVFREFFNESEGRVSLIISAATFAVALFSPFAGIFADAIGRKRIIVPSFFFLAAATFGCAFSSDLNQLIFFRFIAGVFSPGIIAVILAYISEETRREKAGSVTALYVTGTVLGGLTGRLASAYMADYFSWRHSFFLLGLLTLSGAFGVWKFLPRSTKFQKQSNLRKALPSMLAHMQNRQLLATYFAGFSTLFCHVGLFTYSNFYLSRPPFSLSTSALGLIFLVYALGILITPLAGRMIDRIGHRAGAMYAIGFISAGILMTLSAKIPVFVSGLAVASSGIFIMQAAASSHTGKTAKSARSSATGLYVSFYYLGGAAGASFLILPWKLWGWTGLVCSMLLVQLISLIVVRLFFIHKRGSRESADSIVLD